MKKVTKGASCDRMREQKPKILREKVANDMGEKYIIQAPKKKK